MLDLVRIDDLLTLARNRQASDLHLGPSAPPVMRVHGTLVPLDVPLLAGNALERFLAQVAPGSAGERWGAGHALDLTQRTGPGAPYRLHAYRAMSATQLAFRFLHSSVPAFADLDLPDVLKGFVARPSGLVLVTGPTGCGKTTALAALVDWVNRTSGGVIAAVEDPVEYLHEPIRALVAHCEVGRDVADYAAAVHGFMRADPDIIVIGEMRSAATMEAALTAAETGHLVLSSLHTNDAARTVDRIVDAFPSAAQNLVRAQLAATLVAIVSLRLLPTVSGERRVAATEILVATDAVRSLIRDGKTHQLRNAMLTGRSAGMRTLETSLSDLVVRGTVSPAVARACANRPEDVRDLRHVSG